MEESVGSAVSSLYTVMGCGRQYGTEHGLRVRFVYPSAGFPYLLLFSFFLLSFYTCNPGRPPLHVHAPA